ncbi:MAG: sulfatase [Holophagae bacterium]|jgi:arylsulfatase A-like enzyme
MVGNGNNAWRTGPASSCAALALAAAAVAVGCANDRPVNVLLIVVDTLRADHVGSYGPKAATPNIDRLADRGVTFAHAYSHIPITGPSHSSLFTGLLPFEHGVLNNAQILDGRFRTLAQDLANEGRSTAAVVSLGVLKRKYGFDAGFEIYGDRFGRDWMKNAAEVNEEIFAILDGGFTEPYFLWAHYSDPHGPYAPPDLSYPKILVELNGQSLGTVPANGRAHGGELVLPPGTSQLRFIDSTGERAQRYRFSFIRSDDPTIEIRWPDTWQARSSRTGKTSRSGQLPANIELVNPHPETRIAVFETMVQEVINRAEIRRRYALEVEYVDRKIGVLLDRMDDRGLLDETLIIFTSDHGEGLGDHGQIGHIKQLYDSLLHVPLILSFPGRLPEGVVVDETVSLVDVPPTIAQLVGLPAPTGISGTSLLPLISGDTSSPPVFAATYRPESDVDKLAIVARGHKYIHSVDDNGEWEELYDLTADPQELNDLAPSAPPILAELRALLWARVEDSTAPSAVDAALTDEEKAQLEALGYVR